MIPKHKMESWITKIDEFRKNLQVGAGAIISSSYSKENNELYESVTAVRDLLTLYSSYESLHQDQVKRLTVLMKDLQTKVETYITKKATQKNAYSLAGDPLKNVKKAKGDKRTRLLAAANIGDYLKNEITPFVETAQKVKRNDLQELSEDTKDIDDQLGDSEDSKTLIANIFECKKNQERLVNDLDYARRANNARREYVNWANDFLKPKETTYKEVVDDFLMLDTLS